MKKLLYIIIAFIAISCSHVNYNANSIGIGTKMKMEFEDYYTKYQFDSVCISDSIPNNLNMWITVPMKDYEEGEKIYRYLYIKKLDSLEAMYLLYKDKEKYKIGKRITVK